MRKKLIKTKKIVVDFITFFCYNEYGEKYDEKKKIKKGNFY